MRPQTVFEGTAVAIVTPFQENGVDYAALERLIDWQIEQGIDAIVVAGTTGEASTMPDEEHIEVIRQTVCRVNKRVPVIAGTGSNDTHHGAALSKAAQSAGADALLCVTPYYNKTNQSGLVQHFRETAKAVDIPIILYNVPSRTQLNINPESYRALADIEHIVGIKECNMSQLVDIYEACGDRYDLYSGEDGMVLPLMSMGGKGVISVLANIYPEKMIALTHAYLSGNVTEARTTQIFLNPLVKAIFMDVNPIPVKTALNLMGFNVGPCRLPLGDLNSQQLEHLRTCLAQFGLLG